MGRLPRHAESHFVTRIGWLRAAVLGANDGIISTAPLIVAAPGLVARAMSKAAGGYVSERDELADIYMKRGLDGDLARKVSDQLMAKDAPGAHAMAMGPATNGGLVGKVL